jgi:hypothetical protein
MLASGGDDPARGRSPRGPDRAVPVCSLLPTACSRRTPTRSRPIAVVGAGRCRLADTQGFASLQFVEPWMPAPEGRPRTRTLDSK